MGTKNARKALGIVRPMFIRTWQCLSAGWVLMQGRYTLSPGQKEALGLEAVQDEGWPECPVAVQGLCSPGSAASRSQQD